MVLQIQNYRHVTLIGSVSIAKCTVIYVPTIDAICHFVAPLHYPFVSDCGISKVSIETRHWFLIIGIFGIFFDYN